MRILSLLSFLAALGMAAAPVAASAAPVAHSVTSLSAVRASAPTDQNNELFGGTGLAAIFGFTILVGIVAIVVIGSTNNDDGNLASS